MDSKGGDGALDSDLGNLASKFLSIPVFKYFCILPLDIIVRVIEPVLWIGTILGTSNLFRYYYYPSLLQKTEIQNTEAISLNSSC